LLSQQELVFDDENTQTRQISSGHALSWSHDEAQVASKLRSGAPNQPGSNPVENRRGDNLTEPKWSCLAAFEHADRSETSVAFFRVERPFSSD